MRQQRINNKIKKSEPEIIDERSHKIPDIQYDPQYANQPIRSVFYVEVGDMETNRVKLLMKELNKCYDSMRGGIHYIIPIRHGKIGTDIVFEAEFLNVVDQMCEIKDDKIVLKDGAKEVHVVRQSV